MLNTWGELMMYQAFSRMLSLSLLLLMLSACQSTSTDPRNYARQWLDDAGKKNVKVTKVVAGNSKRYKADELYCAETDATTSTGQTYMIAIWRAGSTWSGTEITDGEYEWDLDGCTH